MRSRQSTGNIVRMWHLVKHNQFQCIRPVIVAVDLAHDCLMNVLVLWHSMTIEILLKVRLHTSSDDWKFEPDSKTTRLNNIYIPRILSDFDVGFQYKRAVKSNRILDWVKNRYCDRSSGHNERVLGYFRTSEIDEKLAVPNE